MTESGQAEVEALMRMEERWIAGLTRGLEEREIAQSEWVIRIVRERTSERLSVAAFGPVRQL